MRDLEVSRKYQRLYQRAMKGKSRRAAIRCHCLMCMNWSAKEVERCTATNCPLYPYRLKAGSKAQATAKADI